MYARNWLLGTGCLRSFIGREINPHVMLPSEYRKRLDVKDHFVTNVLRGTKLFVIGNEDDFEAMGK